jgi:hypothetical protein
VDLQGTHAFLATEHKIDDLEPSLQRIIRVLENSSYQDGKTISTSGTPALPVPGAAKFIDLIAAAPWAPYAFRPAPRGQIGFTGIFIWESGFEFGKSHGSYDLGFHRESPSNLDDYQDNTSENVCQEVDNRLFKRGLNHAKSSVPVLTLCPANYETLHQVNHLTAPPLQWKIGTVLTRGKREGEDADANGWKIFPD